MHSAHFSKKLTISVMELRAEFVAANQMRSPLINPINLALYALDLWWNACEYWF